MKLEEQVVSLELAQKLKELGVKQESLFFWDTGKPLVGSNIEVDVIRYRYDGKPFSREHYTAAFTVAELLNVLPASTCLVKKTNIKNPSEVRYYAETFEHHPAISPNLHDENPANALAKLYIELYERN